MKSVGAYQAKTHLSGLLDEVSRGARISITRKGWRAPAASREAPTRTPPSASPCRTSSEAENKAPVPGMDSDRYESYNEASRVVRCFT